MVKINRRSLLKATPALAISAAIGGRASTTWADDRKDTLLSVSETGPNSLDSEVVGANRAALEVTWNAYDRLCTFGLKKDENGNDYYDYTNIQPELAEEWNVTDQSITFRLRKDAEFHDGTPITAKDVKYSYDRAVGVGGYPKFVLSTVSMTKPEQFVAVDDHTFRIDFIRRDPYTLPYTAAPVGFVLNSELVKKHATAADPWGVLWTKNNTAGGGAYKVDHWTPGQEVVYIRNEQWNCGAKPKIQRIIAHVVPSAATRRALVERGDVDFSFEMPPKDAADLSNNKQLKVISTLMDNTVVFVSMNVTMPPFDNPKVRQAISYAIPYQQILDLAVYKRGRVLSGGPDKVASPNWPQPGPYRTDIAKAKALLAEAGFPNGFQTTLSYDLGNVVTDESTSILIQNSLAQIGVKVSLNKIPGANWRSELAAKKLPFLVDIFGGWLAYPYFYFGFVYADKTALHNTSVYQSDAMNKLIDDSHFSADPEAMDAAAAKYIQMAWDDMPYASLYQPASNVVMKNNIGGYSYWFFRQIDYRKLTKA
jgi:peptide/nickel transport system substrate-binding protein